MLENYETDYYAENFPYHVEMFSKFTIDPTILTLYYENGKISQFSLNSLGISTDTIMTRLSNLNGNIVYVYQDKQKTKDIAVELFDITGCCSGSRKLLLENHSVED